MSTFYLRLIDTGIEHGDERSDWFSDLVEKFNTNAQLIDDYFKRSLGVVYLKNSIEDYGTTKEFFLDVLNKVNTLIRALKVHLDLSEISWDDSMTVFEFCERLNTLYREIAYQLSTTKPQMYVSITT